MNTASIKILKPNSADFERVIEPVQQVGEFLLSHNVINFNAIWQAPENRWSSQR
jgi:hypothetical protein